VKISRDDISSDFVKLSPETKIAGFITKKKDVILGD